MALTERVTDDEGSGDLLVRRSAVFAPDLASAGSARRLLRAVLDDTAHGEWADAGELALSEIATNAVLHAHTPFEVCIEVRRHGLWVTVRDGNPAAPQQRAYQEPATTGRGMALVSAVTDDCGVESLGGEGKVVWFRMHRRGPTDEPSADDLLAAWDLDDDWPVDPAAAHATITLRQMPATLWLAARRHHEALLRELVLHQAQHPEDAVDLAAADSAHALVSVELDRAVERAQAEGSARPVVPPGHPAPLPAVPDDLTLEVRVPREQGPAFAALQDALDRAERLAVAGRLLARPGLPEVVAVRDWVCEQVVAQLAGVPPATWGGTAQREFETAVHPRADAEPGWDDTAVREAATGAVAADEANRIVAVSRPLATLLGWDPADLVGRRVVTLIPPRLREAHVAGFSRHLTTGEAHVLGVDLELPVLRADGTEVLCTFLVERAAETRRPVYVAWIDPVG